MFSITNPSGQIVGFSGRIYQHSDQAKYINSTENVLFHKGEVLYNYNMASLEARKLNQIFIFEGFMDVIAVKKAGILNSVATMGTAMTKEHVNLLTKLTKNIVLIFDGDEAGIKAMKRSAQMLSSLKIIPNPVVLPDGWEIKATEHTMWNEVLDDKGRKRMTIFYKAAFYDRDAFANLQTRFQLDVTHVADPNSDYDVWKASDIQGTVKDGDRVIYQTARVPACSDYTKESKMKDVLWEDLYAFMNEHWPQYKDVHAYWDVEVV